MNGKSSALVIYRAALFLFPRHIRECYGAQMVQTLIDARAESQNPASFWVKIYTDLFRSALVERAMIISNLYLRRPMFVYTAVLACALTAGGGVGALVMQQMLRRGADHPQIEMAASDAAKIASGIGVQQVIEGTSVSLEESPESFLIFYGEDGSPQKSQAVLDGRIPQPPPGVFAYTRRTGSDRFSWQPRPGVRIAVVLLAVKGIHPGFLLAGRSLKQVEEYENLLWRIAFGSWFGLMLLLAGGSFLLRNAVVPSRRVTLA